MSFLTESAVRRVAMLPRAIAVSAPRPFTTSLVAKKTATESVKDSLKTVDRAVSDKLVDGIDAATSAADKLKKTTDEMASRNNIAGKAEELKSRASGKASELEAKASGKTSEFEAKASGKASELEGKAKGTAEELKGKAKGAAEQAKRSL